MPGGAHLGASNSLLHVAPFPSPPLSFRFKIRGTEAPAAALARDSSLQRVFCLPSAIPTLMNIHRSTPITIARYGRSRNKTQDFEELSSIRSAEPSQSFSPNLGSPSPPETPNLSHCVSCIGKYLLLEPLEGDHVFRAVHLHSGEELVCKVKSPGLVFAFCLLKRFPGRPFGGGGRSPSSGARRREARGIIICGLVKWVYLFVHVRLVAKFLVRCRQWGGLRRGRFGESPGLGRAAGLRGGHAHAFSQRLVERLGAGPGSAARGGSPWV